MIFTNWKILFEIAGELGAGRFNCDLGLIHSGCENPNKAMRYILDIANYMEKETIKNRAFKYNINED